MVMFKSITSFVRNNKIITFFLMIASWQIYRMVTSDHVKIKVPVDNSGLDYLELAKKLQMYIKPNLDIPLIGNIKLPKFLNGNKNDESIISLMMNIKSSNFDSLANVYRQLTDTSLYEDLKYVLSNKEFDRIKHVFG